MARLCLADELAVADALHAAVPEADIQWEEQWYEEEDESLSLKLNLILHRKGRIVRLSVSDTGLGLGVSDLREMQYHRNDAERPWLHTRGGVRAVCHFELHRFADLAKAVARAAEFYGGADLPSKWRRPQ